MTALDDALAATRYQSYVYGYPHKTAYRPLMPAQPLGPLWAGERRDSLFLYLHVPLCEQRCGFCNLFTRPVPPAALVDAYLATLARQAAVVRRALDDGGAFTIARAAIGGGTPTLLDTHQLARVLAIGGAMGLPAGAPMSVETSPETALPDRLAAVVGGGADRISIGVQSFIDAECKAVHRPQHAADVHRALRAIRDAGPATLNIDLMYGLPGQTHLAGDRSAVRDQHRAVAEPGPRVRRRRARDLGRRRRHDAALSLHPRADRQPVHRRLARRAHAAAVQPG